jgi:hypothetical protein
MEPLKTTFSRPDSSDRTEDVVIIYYNRYKMVAGPGEILVGPVETEFQGRLRFSEDNRLA